MSQLACTMEVDAAYQEDVDIEGDPAARQKADSDVKEYKLGAT